MVPSATLELHEIGRAALGVIFAHIFDTAGLCEHE